MLARRFTIVCLLIVLFGMSLSALVANTSRPARSWDIGTAVPCITELCAPAVRR